MLESIFWNWIIYFIYRRNDQIYFIKELYEEGIISIKKINFITSKPLIFENYISMGFSFNK